MRTFKPLQPKRLLTSAPTALTSRLLRPVSAPVPEPAPPVTQAQLERAAHFEHCFAHVPVFSPSVSVQRQEADGKPIQKRSASEWMEEDAARDEEVAPTALTFRLLQSPRPLTPVSVPEAAFPVTQAKLERVFHPGHSFAQLFEASAPRSAISPSASSLSGLLQNKVPLQRTAEPRPNTTGLSDSLKAGVEDLSGLSLDDVHIHSHSSKPAEIGALAYTQGPDIHVGPGQEQHLAHEAWHVVQQQQGRVKPTMQAKGVAINDDEGLEKEADMMGARAAQSASISLERTAAFQSPSRSIVQREKRKERAEDGESLSKKPRRQSSRHRKPPFQIVMNEMPPLFDCPFYTQADGERSGGKLSKAVISPSCNAVLGTGTDANPNLPSAIGEAREKYPLAHFKAGHLLNAGFRGDGQTPENLTILTGSANTAMTRFDNNVKHAVMQLYKLYEELHKDKYPEIDITGLRYGIRVEISVSDEKWGLEYPENCIAKSIHCCAKIDGKAPDMGAGSDAEKINTSVLESIGKANETHTIDNTRRSSD